MSIRISKNNRIPFPEVILTTTFVVLKLTGVITWPWLWVLSPSWIGLVLYAAAYVVAYIYWHLIY